MIVISGALVLVALVLLVIGLIDPNLGFVYASIAVSLASFGFLVVGILQRRKEELPATDDLPVPIEGITAIIPATPSAASTVKPVAAPAATSVTGGVTGQVLVVAGRPRYHVEGCRYLIGKDAASIEVGDARDEGFTACGVCKPDETLEAAAPETVVEPTPVPVRAARAATATRATVSKATVPVTAAAKAPVAKATVPVRQAAPPKAPTRTAPVKTAPVKTAPVKTTAVKTAPVKTAAKAPVKGGASASKATGKKAAPVKRGGVIVIPDRGKYHTADCRYVRGAEGAVELTKATAARRGYEACGVCNP